MAKENLLLGALSGALVVLSGASYALLFALGRLRNSPALSSGAYLAYATLVFFTVTLSRALALEGFWTAVTGVMLVGYFLAPRAIWLLCAGTHGRLVRRPPANSVTRAPRQV